MKINLNDKIKVKLTDHGKDIYYHQYDETNRYAGREVLKPRMPEVDEEGKTEFVLWEFINLYGSHIRMAEINVIEPVFIWFDENKLLNIKDVED